MTELKPIPAKQRHIKKKIRNELRVRAVLISNKYVNYFKRNNNISKEIKLYFLVSVNPKNMKLLIDKWRAEFKK